MAAAWRRGERPRAEEFLARHPEFDDEDAVRLIYEEVCLRQEGGERGRLDRDPAPVPAVAIRAGAAPRLQSAARTSPREADFPDVGDELGDFRLLAEIGRGAHGRTFLATPALARPPAVVLKITPLGPRRAPRRWPACSTCTSSRSTSSRSCPDRNFRVLGMPYLGGTTLDRILDAMLRPAAGRTHGPATSLEVLDRACSKRLPGDHPPAGRSENTWRRRRYVQAICWIGACLADALQYAHDRGLVHMDVKASNVLIAGDGQPMLLDFHLARGPIGPGTPDPERLGGTPGCMAPEQLAAMDAIRRARPIATPVDGRADIYSLGLLLYEALAGDAGTDPAHRGDRCSLQSPGLAGALGHYPEVPGP